MPGERRRAGVSGHLWPSIAVGLALLGLVLWVNYDSKTAPGDLWTRGTSAVIAIALGIAVLAILERSVPFGIFAAGFLGLAFLSSLYTVINLFQRLGIGGPFDGGNDALPNLLLPGAYLLVGGLCFLAGRRWSVRMHVRVSRLVT